MRRTWMALALSLWASTAHAQGLVQTFRFDWKPSIALAAGQTADLTTTVRGMRNRHCWEANPIMRGADGKANYWRAVPILTGTSIGLGLLQRHYQTDAKAHKVIRWVIYGLAGKEAAISAMNVAYCGW